MKYSLRIAVNLFTAVMPFAAWCMMFRGRGGVLTSHGMRSLKYFTVLSNLLEGTASVIWLAAVIAGVSAELMHRVEVLKFTACLSVFLTFMTVMVFLGPMFGYASMFEGANLWLHLVIPLAALFETILLVRMPLSMRETALTVVPVLIYGSFYLGNILVNGLEEEAGSNDFYGFCTWGLPVGIAIFGLICILVFLSGLVLKKVVSGRFI